MTSPQNSLTRLWNHECLLWSRGRLLLGHRFVDQIKVASFFGVFRVLLLIFLSFLFLFQGRQRFPSIRLRCLLSMFVDHVVIKWVLYLLEYRAPTWWKEMSCNYSGRGRHLSFITHGQLKDCEYRWRKLQCSHEFCALDSSFPFCIEVRLKLTFSAQAWWQCSLGLGVLGDRSRPEPMLLIVCFWTIILVS